MLALILMILGASAQDADEPADPRPYFEQEPEESTVPASMSRYDGPIPEPRFEVDARLGQLHNRSEAYDWFSNGISMPSRGLRAGVRVHDRVAILAGWQRSGRGAEVTVQGEDDSLDFETQSTSFRTALISDQYSVGPKVDLAIGQIFRPYVTVQGMLFHGRMLFDDRPGQDDNPGQLKVGGLSPGVVGMGGLEVRVPQDERPITAALHMELGYGYVASASYGDIGTMRPGGFTAGFGGGIRF